jgi:hypothetical protein
MLLLGREGRKEGIFIFFFSLVRADAKDASPKTAGRGGSELTVDGWACKTTTPTWPSAYAAAQPVAAAAVIDPPAVSVVRICCCSFLARPNPPPSLGWLTGGKDESSKVEEDRVSRRRRSAAADVCFPTAVFTLHSSISTFVR